ncbi:hypothetical protein GCM10027567_13090 [Spongiibacter taiwanensis]
MAGMKLVQIGGAGAVAMLGCIGYLHQLVPRALWPLIQESIRGVERVEKGIG